MQPDRSLERFRGGQVRRMLISPARTPTRPAGLPRVVRPLLPGSASFTAPQLHPLTSLSGGGNVGVRRWQQGDEVPVVLPACRVPARVTGYRSRFDPPPRVPPPPPAAVAEDCQRAPRPRVHASSPSRGVPHHTRRPQPNQHHRVGCGAPPRVFSSNA